MSLAQAYSHPLLLSIPHYEGLSDLTRTTVGLEYCIIKTVPSPTH